MMEPTIGAPGATDAAGRFSAIGQSFAIHEWRGSGPAALHVHYGVDEIRSPSASAFRKDAECRGRRMSSTGRFRPDGKKSSGDNAFSPGGAELRTGWNR